MGSQATVPRIIMTNAVHVAARDTLIIPGRKHPVADTHARAELFITNAPDVPQQQQVHTGQQHHIILLLVVLLDIQQHGLPVAVRVVRINGMVIITFCVLCADVLAILVLSGVLYMLVLQNQLKLVPHKRRKL